jgi:hypothetical protein
LTDPGRHPPPRRRQFAIDAPLAWAILGAVLVALIVALAILLTRPSPVEAPGSSVSASVPVGGLVAPARPTQLADGTWYRRGCDAGGRPHPNELCVGRLDGIVTATLRFPNAQNPQPGHGPPFVRGPAGGLVVTVTQGGGGVAIDRLDARDGDVTQLAVVRGQVPDAAPSRDGRFVTYLLSDDRGLSAVRLATDGSGKAVTVAAPRPRVARGGGVVLAAQVQPSATIVISPDDRTLAIADCFAACTVRIVDAGSGDERVIAGLGPLDSVTSWTDAGIDLGQGCLDPATGVIGHLRCDDGDSTIDWAFFGFGVEVPDGWHVELRPVPGQPQMSFLLHAVAVDPDGEATVLDDLGTFAGQG